MPFADLSLTTNFTFLEGAAHPEEMVARAAELGLDAVAVADRNTLAGVVRAHVAAREIARERTAALREKTGVTSADVAARGARAKGDAGGNVPAPKPDKVALDAKSAPRLIVGARLALDDHPDITALPADRAAYGRLCRLLTIGKRRAEKGACRLTAADLDAWCDGMILLLHGADELEPEESALRGRSPGAALPARASESRRRSGTGGAAERARGRASGGRRAASADEPAPRAAAAVSGIGTAPAAPVRAESAAPRGATAVLETPEASGFEPERTAPAESPAPAGRGSGPARVAGKAARGRTGDGRAGGAGAGPVERAPVRSPEGEGPARDPLGGSRPDARNAAPRRAPAGEGAARTVEAGAPRGSAPPARRGGRAGRGASAGGDAALPDAARWARRLPGSVFLAAAPRYDGRDAERFARVADLAERTGAPMVAVSGAIMHRGARRMLADVLSCIRLGTTIDALGRAAQRNAERRLRSEAEMRALFADHPEAVDRTAGIAERCRFSLDELRYEYPDEACDGEEPQARLARLAWEGLALRYPDGVPDRVRAMAERELALIAKLDYARYFLTVREVVAFAQGRGILCQGRGSAANSVVCYALGVTAIGPEIGTMVFERFVSEARDEPPDIDVDFEHERREEVIQHIYGRYGRERAGLCATVIHYRARRAIREVGRAMGLSVDAVAALASQVWGWSSEGVPEERIREIGLDPTDRRLAQTLALCREIIGFPRHLSQHVGGFVITRGRLDELVPIENAAMEDRTVIEWDKDDIDALGILKVDVLSLGMLTCIRKALALIESHTGARYSLASIPPEDPAVYDMLCDADSLGVFQVESRAQMNFLPRMRPRKFYDLVIQVAIVRPGPIQGDMVHPYLRRRRGEERVEFPSDALGDVLGKTLGVPLFQEQAMQIAIIGAGFDPSEADRLRRALATFRKSGTIHTFRERFVEGMLGNGYDEDFAGRCFSQIEGFGEYGFPESHAASFALLVYASAWIKRHHPAIFACALLNSQPMGFYAPAQIVRDARAHDVEVLPVDVNHSYWDASIEPDGRGAHALRLGFRQVKALKEEDARWIPAARGNGYAAVEDLWRKAGVGPAALTALAEADAFGSLGLARREALWAARAVKGPAPLPLFAGTLEGEAVAERPFALPETTEGEEVVDDYLSLRLSLRAHPLALLRPLLTPEEGGRD